MSDHYSYRKTRFLLFVLISVSLYSGGIPKWYTSGELKGFSSTKNLFGTGAGDTYSKAMSQAQIQIIGQIQVDISSELIMFNQENYDGSESYYKSEISQKIKSSVQQSIKGVEVVKKSKENNTHYVFAVLNKKRYVNSLKSELDQLWSKISILVTDAQSFTQNGNIFSSIDVYTELEPYMTTFYSKKSIYNTFSDFPYAVHGEFSIEKMLQETKTLLSSIRISIQSGSKQSALAGGPLPNPITFNIFLKHSLFNNEIPVPGLPVIIKYDDGTIVEKTRSDESGIVYCYVIANPTGPKGGKIVISPNLAGLPPLYKQYLKTAEAFATYKIVDSPPIAFTLTVVDEKGDRLNKVEDKLTKSIEKVGYSVGPDAELALEGNVTIIDEKEVEGISGLQYLVTAELDMFMVVKMNGEKIASFDAKGKGLSKKNLKDANKKAFQKLKLSKKNLAGMLAEAEEELKRIFTKKSSEKLREGKALYAQDKLKEAIVPLTKVTHDEGQFEEAIRLIGEIKAEINRIEAERVARIEEEKRKIREQEMALAQLAAETERARQLAELEIATTMAAAHVSSAQISADANVLVAQYGVDEAELNARVAELETRTEESKITIDQIKKNIEQYKLEKFEPQESIIVAETELDVAKANTIGFVARRVEKEHRTKEPVLTSLSPKEKAIVGDWRYLGMIENNSRKEDYSGIGTIFSIADDRTFTDESTTGSWSVENDNFLVNNSFQIPFVVNINILVMFVDITGVHYLRIYEQY